MRDQRGADRIVARGGVLFLAIALSIAPPARGGEDDDTGRLERDFASVEREVLRQEGDFDANVAGRFVSMLRRLGRDVEADAFTGYLDRAKDQSDDDLELLRSLLERCWEQHRRNRRDAGLVHPLQRGRLLRRAPAAAAYALDLEGRPAEIEVLLARDPSTAWSLIESVVQAPVDRARLAVLPLDAFPVRSCVFWHNGLRLDRNWFRVRNEVDADGPT